VLGGLAATAAATQNNSAPTLTGVWDFSSSDGAGVFDLTQAGPNITGQIVSDWECSGFAQLPCPYACTGAINGPNVRLDCINHSGVIYLRPCSTGTHVLAGQIISMLANSALNHMTGTEAGRCDPGTVPATMTKRP